MVKEQIKAKEELVLGIKKQIEYDVSNGLFDQVNDDLFGTMGGSSYRQSTIQRRYGSGFFSARNSQIPLRDVAASGPKSGLDKMFETEAQNMR